MDLRKCRPEWGKWRWAQLSWRELLRHWHRLWMYRERYLWRRWCLQLGLERQQVAELGDWLRRWLLGLCQLQLAALVVKRL